MERLDALPPPPPATEHLWQWWQELHAARGHNGWSWSRLGWSDIDAWARLTGAMPRASEIRVVMQIDAEWLLAESRRRAAQQPKGRA